MLNSLGLLDDFLLGGKGIVDAIRSGKPGSFFKDANVGLVGGLIQGMGHQTNRRGAGMFASKGAAGLRKGFKSALKSPKVGWDMSFGAFFPLIAANAAYSASKEQPGERGSTFAGSMVGSYAGAAMGAVFGGAPGAFVGSMFLSDPVSEAITGGIRKAQSSIQRKRSLSMSSRFRDSFPARTMRQRAAEEMSGSLMNARQILGQESAFLHS